MKPLVMPGLVYLILYPLLVGAASYFLNLSQFYLTFLSGIYLFTALIILFLWLMAKTRRIIVGDGVIIFSSILGKTVVEPQDIRRASFAWTKNNEEIVLLKTGKRKYYLSDLYFPFNELLTDLEEIIAAYNIRSNLNSHYGLN
jgi:hypothetical protein